jgi:uncharacterized protein DUF87
MSVGPRSMVFATYDHAVATPVWWGYGGNLSGTWQCFLPIVGWDEIRSRDWEGSLLDLLGLPPRAIGAGRQDARRIGSRLKKYAVLHPYVNQLSVAAVLSGDGIDLLDALKVIDEQPGTPAGAKSIKDLRYELTILGPRSPRLGRAIDAAVTDPGDARWSKYADAVLDNPETVLSPGFAFARRPIDTNGKGSAAFWEQMSAELEAFKDRGLHVALLGSMLTAGIAVAPTGPTSLIRGGLAVRPRTTVVTPEAQQSPYQGDWVLAITASHEGKLSASEDATSTLVRALNLAHGICDSVNQVGLSVALAGPMARVIRRLHRVSDWVITSDPLFSIELMDRRRVQGHETVMLDFTPEFDPYPGGRVVVTTNSIADVEDIGGKVTLRQGAVAAVLASVSARLLLALSNPTKQIVGGLTGLALTRLFVADQHPGALVIPVDGHESMFTSRKPLHSGEMADLLVVAIRDNSVQFHVYESKYAGSGAITALLDGGMKQARMTADVLRDEYLTYAGLDRAFRIEGLRDIVLFHLARSQRHGVSVDFTPSAVLEAFNEPGALGASSVTSSVVGWTPNGIANAGPITYEDGLKRWLMGAEDIERFAAFLTNWPLMQPRDSGVVREVTDALSDGAQDEARAADVSVSTSPEWKTMGLSDAQPDKDPSDREHYPADEEESVVTPSEQSWGHVEAEPKLDVSVAGGTSLSPRSEAGAARLAADDTVGVDLCVRLGRVAGSGKPAVWCPPLLSNGHLMLVGGSGAGKTTALRQIIWQLRAAGVPVLVLDFHGDISPVDWPEKLYRFEYAANSVYVNPFHLDARYNLIPIRLRDQFIEAWKRRYYSMGIQQYNYLVDLIDEAFISKGITSNPSTWTGIVTFADVIAAFERSDAAESTKDKIRAYMRQFSEWQIFHGGTGIAIEEFLDESVRLDLSQLDENARGILADVVLRRLFLLCSALGPLRGQSGWKKFRAYVVIDEAQILMGSQGDAKASLSRYTAEARKFGIGLILATQLKDNVPDEIWGNIDTRLFMQALDPGERVRNAKAAGVAEETLRTLSRGEGILTSSSQALQRPVKIRIEANWLTR